jgi:hypothetical protein
MTKKFLSLFIIISLLVGCGPVTPIAPAPTAIPIIPTATATPIPEPVVKFLPPDFLGNASDYGATLSVGIFAITKDIVFLFGGIGDPSGGQQSTLLRSEDGGRHWLEVVNPQKGSDVIDFQMLDTGEGWALIMWVVEGPGAPILFHTKDFGETWTQLSQVPKPEWYAYPVNMVFFDGQHGQMEMNVVGGLNDRLAFMTTFDGGLSWEETGSYTPPFDDYEVRYSAIIALSQVNRKDSVESTSLDYSTRWKVETTDESIIIYRQLHENFSWSNWEIVNKLPKHFDYQDGQIIVP